MPCLGDLSLLRGAVEQRAVVGVAAAAAAAHDQAPDPGLEADPRHIAQPAQLGAQRHQLAARRRWLLLVCQAQQLVKQSEHTWDRKNIMF